MILSSGIESLMIGAKCFQLDFELLLFCLNQERFLVILKVFPFHLWIRKWDEVPPLLENILRCLKDVEKSFLVKIRNVFKNGFFKIFLRDVHN